MNKGDWLLVFFMVFVLFFFGIFGVGLHYDQKRRHECKMEMVKEKRPAHEIKEICQI